MLSVPWPVKYQWLACADNPAAEIQDGIQVDQTRGGPGADHAHLVEHDGHQHRRKEFKESLHPKMDDPEVRQLSMTAKLVVRA